jgi:hypothetical protein
LIEGRESLPYSYRVSQLVRRKSKERKSRETREKRLYKRRTNQNLQKIQKYYKEAVKTETRLVAS